MGLRNGTHIAGWFARGKVPHLGFGGLEEGCLVVSGSPDGFPEGELGRNKPTRDGGGCSSGTK